MSIYTSSRAEAYKREREEKKRAAESSGTSVTTQTENSRKNERRNTNIGTAPKTASAPKTTVPAGVPADKPAAKPAVKNSGYVPTYGNGLLYTSAGNTATAPKVSDNGRKTDHRNATTQQNAEVSYAAPEPQEPVYEQYKQAKENLTAAEDAVLKKQREAESYQKAYQANHSLSDRLYLEKTTAEYRDLYKAYTDANEKYEQFYSNDGGAAVIESLDAEMKKLSSELGKKQSRLTSIDGIAGDSEQRTALATEIADMQEQYAQYDTLRTEAATAYYMRENEKQFSDLRNNPHASALYDYAKTTQEDMKRLENVTAYEYDPAGSDAEKAKEDLAYLQEKYGYGKTVLGDDLYHTLTDTVTRAEVSLSEEGFAYDRMAEYDQMLADKEAAEIKKAEWAAYAEEKPGWATAASVLAAPARGLDYVTTMVGGIGRSDPGDYRNYVPMNTYNMHATNYVDTIRGTVSDNIDSKVGKFLYDVGVGVADSFVMLGVSAVAGIPQFATVSMGMGAASEQAKDIIERGGTNRQAFWGGLAAGAVEYLCEKVPLDNLLKTKTPKTVKGVLTNAFKQMAIEGGEEAVTEVANIISDAVIMKDNSEFNNRVDAYMAEGMGENKAKQKALMDAISDVALAGAGGLLAGGMTGGIVNVGKYGYSKIGRSNVDVSAQILQDTHTGKTVKTQGKVTELLQKAMAEPSDSPAHKLAGKLLGQQQTALVEQGLELGSQYQISHAEQAKIAEKIANHAVSDREIGELFHLMEQENLTEFQNRDIFKKSEGEYPLSRYFNSSELICEQAKKVVPIDGYEDIFIHGNATGFSVNDADGNMLEEYTPREFAEILKNDPNYHGGDIRLCSCCTGADGAIAAKVLARQLGVNVLAPSDILWIHTDGSMTIGNDAIINDGKWILFEGKG